MHHWKILSFKFYPEKKGVQFHFITRSSTSNQVTSPICGWYPHLVAHEAAVHALHGHLARPHPTDWDPGWQNTQAVFKVGVWCWPRTLGRGEWYESKPLHVFGSAQNGKTLCKQGSSHLHRFQDMPKGLRFKSRCWLSDTYNKWFVYI